ncbi:MAG: M20 family metallo-hydrolase [Candidatus Micrarchaeia archaeon]
MDIFSMVESHKKEMISTMKDMIAIQSISPESGGHGESKRADFLEGFLHENGIKTKRFDYFDKTKTKRSNIVSTMGKKEKTLWIISHIDTVAAGDLSLWKHNPFDVIEKDGKLYGRGTSDNGQGVISAIFAFKALKELDAELKYNIGIALVADEEVGSEYGVKALMKEGIFKANDMAIVPDWGTEKGDRIEVAEKGVLWLEFKVKGKQVHASTPQLGINAYRASILLLSKLDFELHKKFNKSDALFEPKISTFEMTKHLANVDSVNIVPGSETFYIDCRVLPSYKLDNVLASVKKIANEVEKSTKAHISFSIFNREDPAKPTKVDSPVVKDLMASIYAVNKIKTKFVGIGGGTVAKHFRDKSMDVAVWATLPDNAHQPNEYNNIKDMINDTKVFANMFVA